MTQPWAGHLRGFAVRERDTGNALRDNAPLHDEAQNASDRNLFPTPFSGDPPVGGPPENPAMRERDAGNALRGNVHLMLTPRMNLKHLVFPRGFRVTHPWLSHL